jgi:hypothetical protein
MTERFRTYLLIVTLMVATAGATVGVMGLKERGQERATVMIVRLGHAPVEWNGWQLIPPSDSDSCEQGGYDACSDGQGADDEPIDSRDDNPPSPI